VDSGKVQLTDLPESMRFQVTVKKEGKLKLDDVITDHINEVLTLAKGNKTLAAEILGIDRKTLRSKLNKISGSEPH
jgi:DNA-binding protein Fis